MGLLHTDPEHRRKGFAKMCTLALSNHLTKKNVKPFVGIEDDNVASEELFKSMGFEKWGRRSMITWKPKPSS